MTAQPFVQNEPCLVNAADGCIMPKAKDYLRKLIDTWERFNADSAFIVLEIDNPNQYGIIEGEEVEPGIMKVYSAVEKSDKPKDQILRL